MNSRVDSVVNIGILEVRIDPDESIEKRIEKVLRILQGVQSGHFDLLVLPELWISGAFDFKSNTSLSQSLLQEALLSISTLANQKSTFIHSGTHPMKDSEGKLFNTAIIFDSLGQIVCKYNKIHLFGFDEGERLVFEPGMEVTVIDFKGRKIGVSTCYDLRFPELYINQIKQGAEVLLISAAWPTMRINHWNSLLQARAIESQAYVIGCNALGRSLDIELGGNSSIFSPTGQKLSPVSSQEIIEYEIELGLVSLARSDFPVLQDRVITVLSKGHVLGN
jgi:predicted amidohydrolase